MRVVCVIVLVFNHSLSDWPPKDHVGLYTLLADYPLDICLAFELDGWGSGDLEPAIAPEPLPFLVALVRDAVGRAVVADAELRH